MIKSKKLSERYHVTDGDNSIYVTVYPDYTFEIMRQRVKDESFIEEGLKVLTESITV